MTRGAAKAAGLHEAPADLGARLWASAGLGLYTLQLSHVNKDGLLLLDILFP